MAKFPPLFGTPTPLWRRAVTPAQQLVREDLAQSLMPMGDPECISITAALACLGSSSVDPRVVVNGLLNFVQDVEDVWFEWDQRSPAGRDPVADKHRFVAQKLELHLERFSDRCAAVILWRLQHDVGNKVRGKLDAAIEQNLRRQGGVASLESARKLLQELIDSLGKRLNAGPGGFLSGFKGRTRYNPDERVAVELALLSAWGM